ncbi:hypothetical protein DPMN_180248 [Dreissena polymorpha]|uniref:Uncharacterized protein n=1 Tax=Dreissena polymorpha TaxID=45954 RepID=A0A9D4IN34_DREPO|nr:hypothetical protein DPMN_180248 [Dreissena polymorpha]
MNCKASSNLYNDNCIHFADHVFKNVTSPEAYASMKQRFNLDLIDTGAYEKKYRRITEEELMAYARECEAMRGVVTMSASVKIGISNLQIERFVHVLETNTGWWSIELFSGTSL